MKKNLLFIFILFSVFNTSLTYSQTWKPLGPDDFNQASYDKVSSASIALDRSGNPYVAFCDERSGRVGVSKYSGGRWEYLEAAGISPGAYGNYISIGLDGSGTPYVAYRDGDGKASVKKYIGGNWEDVGMPGFSAGQAVHISLALNSSGTPYVAYMDEANGSKATVKKYNGSSWENVGELGFSTGRATSITIAFDGSGTPYVAYGELKATVKKYNGSSWVDVGKAGFSAAQAGNFSFAFDNIGTPYLGYKDFGIGGKAIVKKYIGDNWVNVGTAGFSTGDAGFTSIAIDGSGTLYIAYCDNDGYGIRAAVKKYNGSSWENVGTTSLSTMSAKFTSIVFDNSGNPCVLYAEEGNNFKATVKKYISSSWEVVGTVGFSAGGAQYTSLAHDASGTPYVAYKDYENGSKVTVKKYNGSSWEGVGTLGFSAGEIMYTSISIDRSGTPYVAYCDYVNSRKITVKKYNGSSWVDVGTPGFSGGNSYDITLVLDDSGTPYIAFTDYWGSGYKITVKKFNGNTWTDVGTPSAYSGEYPSIAIDGSGIPYLAFRDAGNPSGPRATVKRYNGNTWESVGTEVSAQWAGYNFLAFDRSGTPYWVYSDGGNGYKATVKKYDGSNWVNVGAEGFSEDKAYYTSLAFDVSGTPYVVYKDGDYGKITVKMYNGNSWKDISTSCSAGQAAFPNIAISNGKLLLVYSSGGAYAKEFTLKKAQTITFASLADETFGNADAPLNATSDAGLEVSYNSSNADVATIVNGQIHIVGAGQTDITATQAGNNEYLAAIPLTRTLKVNAKRVTVTSDAKNKVYGNTDPNLTYTVTSGSLVGNDSFTGSLNRIAGEDAGTYAINQGTLMLSANYDLTFIPASLIINKKALTISANNLTKVYGDINPSLSISYNGFVAGEDAITLQVSPMISTTATITSVVGNYPILVSGASSNNYSISYVNGLLTVNKAALIISADNKTKIQNTPNPELTVTYTGFVNNETYSALNAQPIISSSVNTNTMPGVYPIEVGGASADNYEISYSNGSFTVIAITPNSISFAQNSLFENQPPSTVVGTLSSTSDDPNAVFTYSLVAGNGDSDNALFNISGDKLITVVPLNYEERNTYSIRIRCTAASGLFFEKVLTVFLSDINEASTVLDATNLITPNGDGVNDKFVIRNIDMYPDNEIKIVDRIGRLLYTKKGYNNEWDGYYNGNPLAEDTYYYILILGKNMEIVKGFISILRN